MAAASAGNDNRAPGAAVLPSVSAAAAPNAPATAAAATTTMASVGTTAAAVAATSTAAVFKASSATVAVTDQLRALNAHISALAVPARVAVVPADGDGADNRALLATRPLRPGDTLLCAALPAVYCATRGHACDFCLRRAEEPADGATIDAAPVAADAWARATGALAHGGRLRRCETCRWASFCSPACRDAVRPLHEDECAGLRALSASRQPAPPTDDCAFPESAVLGARLWRLWHRPSGTREIDDMAALARCLWSNRERTPASIKERLVPLAVAMIALVRTMPPGAPPVPIPSATEAVEMICLLRTNTFSISTGDGLTCGAGVYPIAAMLNHSCVPNCCVSFAGRVLAVHCVRPVCADEPLTIAYVDPLCGLAQRRAALREQYLFDCRCAACCYLLREHGEPIGDAEFARARRRLARTDAYRCPRCKRAVWKQRSVTDDTVCPKCGTGAARQVLLRELDAQLAEGERTLSASPGTVAWLKRVLQLREQCLHPAHWSVLELRGRVVDALIGDGHYAEALRWTMRQIHALRAVRPFHHYPPLGIELLRAAKLLACCSAEEVTRLNRHMVAEAAGDEGRDADADVCDVLSDGGRAYLGEAADIFCISMGPDASMTCLAQAMISDIPAHPTD